MPIAPPEPRRGLAAPAAIAVTAVAAAALLVFAGTHQGIGQPKAPSIAGVQTFTGLGRRHVNGSVRYGETPPAGGDHDPIWQSCNGTVYPAPIRNENGVHSLEHGAVWVTYAPGLGADQVEALTRLVFGHPYRLLSPFPGLPAPVVATAWGKQLQLPSASDPRLARFLDAYTAGPQAPEPGASCSGGIGA